MQGSQAAVTVGAGATAGVAAARRLDLGASPPRTPDGEEVRAYELVGEGLRVEVLSWGLYISKIVTPDCEGRWADVALGFDFPEDFAGYHVPGIYGGRTHWFGSVIGRYCGRIAQGRFELNGEGYQLAKNLSGQNHLHGGSRGWDQRTWQELAVGLDPATGDPFVSFGRTSEDGEEGYPAALDCMVTYSIVGGDALSISYDIKNLDAAKSTVVNVTNHSYFNLSGSFERPVYNHELLIAADEFCAVDEGGLPTELRRVRGTPFDFTEPYRIGDRIDVPGDEQLKRGAGYDHSFLLAPTAPAAPTGPLAGLRLAARVTEPGTRRRLEAFTSEPAVHLYSANHVPLTKGAVGKGSVPFGYRSGFCLETQHLPDSPNHADYPSTALGPGARMTSRTAYRFRLAALGECLPPVHAEEQLSRPDLE